MVKVQQRNHLENVISDADYLFLKNQLKKDGRMTWYFIVWYLAATGARVSELVQIKVEHVYQGYVDIYSKGGKIRRLYISIAVFLLFCHSKYGCLRYCQSASAMGVIERPITAEILSPRIHCGASFGASLRRVTI